MNASSDKIYFAPLKLFRSVSEIFYLFCHLWRLALSRVGHAAVAMWYMSETCI